MDSIRALISGSERYVIGEFTVELREKLSEGGFAYVYKAVDLTNGQEFAVKKILCQSSELLTMAEREIRIMQALPPHENLVHYYGSLITTQSGTKVALILMELCIGGTLVNLLEKYNGVLSQAQIFYIIKEIASGLQVVHSQGLVHRDIKIENVLLNNKKFKLCDFGSCGDEIYDLTSASRQQLLTYQEKFERETTLMYRPPEMIDLYTRHQIDYKGDSWMLGCVLFTLAFCKHPFQDQSQLAIVNAHYTFPNNSRFDEKFHGMITWILNPNPNERPSISEICRGIENYDKVQCFAEVKKQVRGPKRIDRDLTEAEMNKEMARVRNEIEAKEFPKKAEPVNIWVIPPTSFQGPTPSNSTGWAKF